MDLEKTRQDQRIIWITGLSGSGKTTIAQEISSNLRAQGKAVVLLDGDELREIFGASTLNEKNHGRASRLLLAMQYSNLCKMIGAQGITVVIATISMFDEIHEWNRKNLSGYFEVYIKVSQDELRRRDPKGIYRKFDSGEIKNVAGIDLKVDEPKSPDLILEYINFKTPEICSAKILKAIQEANLKCKLNNKQVTSLA